MAFLREPLACSQDVPHAAGKWQCFLDDNSSHNRPVPPAPLQEEDPCTVTPKVPENDPQHGSPYRVTTKSNTWFSYM